jgi:hypothetical protein
MSAVEPLGPLDQPIAVTFFETFAADRKREEHYTMRGLANRILAVTAASKGQLPWLKLARFGDQRTDKNSLRHDTNVLAIGGIEVDYDGGGITIDEAVETLEKAGVAGMVYTSPSHSEDSPRWRVLCPTSMEMPGDRRHQLVGRLNGLFRGTLAGESFTLSQSYYYGSVRHNPSHRVELVDGSPIDEHDELDEIWIGKPNTASKPGQVDRSGPADLHGLLSDIINGTSYHTATARIAGLFAKQRVPYMEAHRRLVEAMEAVPQAQRDQRWQSRYIDLDRTLEDIYGKEAAKRDAEVLPEPPPAPEDPGYWASIQADSGMSADDWREVDWRESGHAIPSSAEAQAKAGTDVLWSITEAWNEDAIPPRPWIAPGYLMRGSVTVISGPGSAGKSSLMVGWATALAIGCAFHGMSASTPMRVATYNVEDDGNEQKRRFSAMLQRMGCTHSQLGGRLAILGPARVGTLLHAARDGTLLVNTPVMDRLEAFVKEFRPDVLMLDPFVELHAAEENDNTAIRAVMARFRAMAIEHNMAVVLLHHSRKGTTDPGDPDTVRGASSIIGAARVAQTINRMAPEEAEGFGIQKEKRRNYFRLDGAKSNYAAIEEAKWFELQVCRLANGDGVAVAWPWQPPSLFSDLSVTQTNAALDRIAAGYAPGVPYRPNQRGGASPRWVGNVLMSEGLTEEQAKQIIAVWLRTGLLFETTYKDHESKMRPGILVDDAKRPT